MDEIRNERISAVRKLYGATFGTILNTLQEDRDLLATQAYDVVGGLVPHLDSYDGELDEYPFLLWALSILEPAARFAVILSKYQKLIRYRIHQELSSNVADLAVDDEDVFQDVSLLIFQNIESLARRGTARLPRRLSALIHRHCGFIHKKRRNRRRIVKEYGAGDALGIRGVATMTPEEQASQRFDEMGGEDGYYRSETIGKQSWGYRSA
jgi:hypothetical protein